ncbi:hypothetical protein HL667_06365 [Bradyrhizobium sp. 83012]|uniref:Uncharacterized protein n=1 Tax=Bradyrhizobium aeschynomenes TaxID=2734909 RepID=A0ABX2C8N8_9BRAD|nr:hypothetical protein [Bradyrhizobium aeschynomenes]NPU64616.1 hypothetical protein [Bradyrhizobium aeschynomenes]
MIKINDYVRIIPAKATSSRLKLLLGKDLRVLDVRDNYIDVDAPEGRGIHIGRFTRLGAEEIRVGTYVIMLYKDGKLMPAPNPKVYTSDVQANKIAELMAAKHGGTFQVFKATGEFTMPVAKPTYRAL